MTAFPRVRVAAAAVVVALALSGCASSPALTSTAASELQQDVLAVTTAAKGGDVTAALAALDEATAELEAAYARGDVTKERHDLITAAIAAVRAKLEGTQQSTSGPTGTTAPTTTNPKPRSSTGTDTDTDADAPMMTPAPGTNGTTAPKPSATPTPTATATAPPVEPEPEPDPEPSTPAPEPSPAPSASASATTEGLEADSGGNQTAAQVVPQPGQ